ncbi:MAG: zinc-binding alcohol dehydrogenase [Planctomycetes bacterium]|nr:zinc-binding alcohol dehydrogenase [Planctomycetota bacterium]
MAKDRYRTLLFAGPRRIEFREQATEPLKPDEVRIQTMYSGISRGTEMTVYRGTSPYLKKRFDPQTKLFRATEQPSWQYPIEFGYENVGRIVETGPAVQGFGVGDVVFTPTQHTEMLVMSTTQTGPFFGDLVPVVKLPAGLAPELGVFLALAGVAYNAMLDGEPLLGESVAVFGGGVIGLLSVQLCRLAGAEQVFLIEPIASRRELGRKMGATHSFDPSAGEDVSLAIRELTAGRGADVAIEVTGAYAALHEAIRSVGYNGRVVVSSYLAGYGEAIELGDEFHHNRVRLISSQSFGVNPAVSDRWNPARRTLATLNLLPRLQLAPMITHRFKFDQAGQAFDVLDRQPDQVLQVVLTYG